jgi:hypothetical protein
MDRIVKQTVRVWEQLQEITVYQKSKSVWVAVGDYKGERLGACPRNADNGSRAEPCA